MNLSIVLNPQQRIQLPAVTQSAAVAYRSL
jgi:hypothetical protein